MAVSAFTRLLTATDHQQPPSRAGAEVSWWMRPPCFPVCMRPRLTQPVRGAQHAAALDHGPLCGCRRRATSAVRRRRDRRPDSVVNSQRPYGPRGAPVLPLAGLPRTAPARQLRTSRVLRPPPPKGEPATGCRTQSQRGQAYISRRLNLALTASSPLIQRAP